MTTHEEPQLETLPVHCFLRSLDRLRVVLGLQPSRRRDHVGVVEAVKPVICHASKPCFSSPLARLFSPETILFAVGFQWALEGGRGGSRSL